MKIDFENEDEIRMMFESLMQVDDIIAEEAAPEICAVMRSYADTKL